MVSYASILCFSGAALLLPITTVEAAPSSPPAIGLIDGDTDEKLSVINIRLSKKPQWQKLGEIQSHGSFLQLVLPDTVVPDPGKFFDGNNPYLPKVAVLQLTPSDAGIRFFASQDAAKIKQAMTAELLGDRIVVSVDHSKLTTVVPDKATFVGPPAPERGADAVIAHTEVRHDIPPPSDLVKQDSGGLAQLATGGLNLREKLVQAAVFSGLMLAILVASWLARPFLKRRAIAKGRPAPEVVHLKTLATLPLAARQKVSLLQVGDEKILIGVTPENITFLTAVGRKEPPRPMFAAPEPSAATFSRLLSESAPAAVELHQAPVLKKLPGNDPETLRDSRKEVAEGQAPVKPKPTPSQHGAPVKPKKSPAGQKVNVAVGEDGVKDLGKAPATPASPGQGQKAIDDVTRLIREKLKTLRTI